MSRIGKQPIAIPKGVKTQIDGAVLRIEGPKGKLVHTIPACITVEAGKDEMLVSRSSDERRHRSLHGLTRTLVANMVEGVTQGFKRELEIVGVGYKAEKAGKMLKLSVGLSHIINFDEPDGIQINVEKQIIRIEGIDKCLVGQTASKIRMFKKPDVYKGKGIRYVGEVVRKKVGKAGAK